MQNDYEICSGEDTEVTTKSVYRIGWMCGHGIYMRPWDHYYTETMRYTSKVSKIVLKIDYQKRKIQAK